MRIQCLLSTLLSGVALIPTIFAEQITQPIHQPTSSTLLAPNTSLTITWTPDRHFSSVTLELWDSSFYGHARDFGAQPCYHWPNPFCGTIASHAPNIGAFNWRVPEPMPGREGKGFPPKLSGLKLFWIKIYVDDYLKSERGFDNTEPVVSFSERFAFAIAANVEQGRNESRWGPPGGGPGSYGPPPFSGAAPFGGANRTALATVTGSMATLSAVAGPSETPNATVVPEKNESSRMAVWDAVRWSMLMTIGCWFWVVVALQ
ncbi:hypothetical protein GQ43DRAFT_439146 [Delitschia confertaspora ATCC 74209]|uniref:Uncharacterized protein n=1 Tax=Delitschia confertaspora ATCC 74209 TaxID=1513339 RepID=A0A9P4JTN8_9PLEO|nr:hypothetical protein GQ43DRAFT_439146 [Delitschia confertaspora ATCC 74209]